MSRRQRRSKRRSSSASRRPREIKLTKRRKKQVIEIVGQIIGRGKRTPNAAFMKPMQPDAALSAVVGVKAIPRTQVTKKIWAYVKRNALQDKKRRTLITADDRLRRVFGGKKQISMFEMTKLVNKHLK